MTQSSTYRSPTLRLSAAVMADMRGTCGITVNEGNEASVIMKNGIDVWIVHGAVCVLADEGGRPVVNPL